MRVRRTGVRRQGSRSFASSAHSPTAFLARRLLCGDVLNARRPEDRADHGADLWNVLVAFVGSMDRPPCFFEWYQARSLSP